MINHIILDYQFWKQPRGHNGIISVMFPMPEMAGGRSRVNRIPDIIKRLHLIFVSYTTVKLEVGWGKTESKSSFSDPDTKLWPKRQIQPNTFVNKILLQCTYLCILPGYFLVIMAELNRWNRMYIVQSLKYLLSDTWQ